MENQNYNEYSNTHLGLMLEYTVLLDSAKYSFRKNFNQQNHGEIREEIRYLRMFHFEVGKIFDKIKEVNDNFLGPDSTSDNHDESTISTEPSSSSLTPSFAYYATSAQSPSAQSPSAQCPFFSKTAKYAKDYNMMMMMMIMILSL